MNCLVLFFSKVKKVPSYLVSTEISKIFFYFLIIFYPIIPSYTLLFGVRLHSIIAFLSLVFLLISKEIRRINIGPINLSIVILILLSLSVVSIINGDILTTSFPSMICQFFVIPFYIYIMMKDEKNKDKTIKILIIVGFVLCLLSVLELFGFNIFSLVDNGSEGIMGPQTGKRFGIWRIESSFSQSIAYAIYLTYVLILVFYYVSIYPPKTKFQIAFCTTLILFFNAFIVLTLSRFPIIVALVVDLFGFFFLNKKMKITISIAVVVVILITFLVSLIFGGGIVKKLFDNVVAIISGHAEQNDNPLIYRLNLLDYVRQVVIGNSSKLAGVGLQGNYTFFFITQYFYTGAGVLINNSFDNGLLFLYVSQGIIGSLAWAIYYCFLAYLFLEKYKNNNNISILGIATVVVTIVNMFSVARLDEARMFCVMIPLMLSIADDRMIKIINKGNIYIIDI